MISRMHDRYRKEVVPALMKRFARLNIGTSPELIGEAVHRMAAALAD